MVGCCPEATQAATFNCFVPPRSSDLGRRQRSTSTFELTHDLRDKQCAFRTFVIPATSDRVQERMPAAGMNSHTDNEGQQAPNDVPEQPDLPMPTTPEVDEQSESSEGERPPLPPRPNTLSLLRDEAGSGATLQAEATTAISRTEIGTQSPGNGGSAYSTLASRGLSKGPKARASLGQLASPRDSEAGDSASIRSSIPNADAGDVEALFLDFAATGSDGQDRHATGLLEFPEFAADDIDDEGILSEFEAVGELNEDGDNEGMVSLSPRFLSLFRAILTGASIIT